jgi:hypothetical protein
MGVLNQPHIAARKVGFKTSTMTRAPTNRSSLRTVQRRSAAAVQDKSDALGDLRRVDEFSHTPALETGFGIGDGGDGD